MNPCRQEQADEDGDNGYHHQQFDQREAPTGTMMRGKHGRSLRMRQVPADSTAGSGKTFYFNSKGGMVLRPPFTVAVSVVFLGSA
jgi:hypothetical protein